MLNRHLLSSLTRSLTASLAALCLASPAAALCNFDIDDSNGTLSASVDGLLLVRHMAGFRGDRLIDGAIQPSSKRRTATDIQTFIGTQVFDIDGNRTEDPLTDGLIITRYLQGITGPALVKGALGKNATRTDPTDVLNYLKSIDGCGNTPSLVLSQAFPIEVFGEVGTEKSVTLSLTAAQASSAQRLWLQTHNIRYATKASIKINGGAWLPLNNTNAQMVGTNLTYGGIGGSLATLKMSIPVAAGLLTEGSNTITFKFNETNNVSMGYRVIGMNLLNSSGDRIIPASGFTQSDPASWTGPSTTTADINAGKALWATAQLKAHFDPPGNTAPNIIAKCADCHTATGFDLKYFGYSNNAIIERSKFHGLSQTQGEQIASYIRSLPVKAVGRPWNPPYQPGPGTSSKPNDEWAAGAGIDNVLDDDWDTIQHIFPNGIKREALMVGDTTKFKRFDTHDVPIAFQLPDWNHWLPEVHPYDAFGKTWAENTPNFKQYENLKTLLTGKTEAQIQEWFRTSNNGEGRGKPFARGLWAMLQWGQESPDDGGGMGVEQALFRLPPEAFDQRPGNQRTRTVPNGSGETGRVRQTEGARKIYSLVQWRMTKQFDIHEGFGLTSMGPYVNTGGMGPFRADLAGPRMWVGANRSVFDASPFLSALDYEFTGSSSGDNAFNFDYLSNAWYQLQLILNPGHRSAYDHSAVDWGYAHGFLSGFNRLTDMKQSARNLIWSLKGMDEGDNDRGPNRSDGWSFRRGGMDSALGFVDDIPQPATGYTSRAWVVSPTAEAKQVHTLLRQVWLEKVASWLPIQMSQYTQGEALEGGNPYPGGPFLGNPKSGDEDGGIFNRPDFVLTASPSPETRSRSFAYGTDTMMLEYKQRGTYPAAMQNGYATWAQAVWPGIVGNAAPQNDWLKYRVGTVGTAPSSAPLVSAGTTANSVNVSWSSVAGAQSYNVKRADSPSGPFLTIAYFRTGSSYTETVPMAGTGRTYYYRTTTNTAAGESPDSASASIQR
ncbi:MAG: hypothetical protein EAZ43_13880 [Betaproteobacteria bacterium]|nr:MAG: hypothetical protein EAZ43_13880 [Betaproteobacteria bacterium]